MQVYITDERKCARLATQNPAQPVEEETALLSGHEEADTHIILHAKHAADHEFGTVLISSLDTDVLAIALGAFAIDRVPNTASLVRAITTELLM